MAKNTNLQTSNGSTDLEAQAQAVIGKATASRRSEALASGTLNRRIVTLSEGDCLDGLTLIGPGAPVEVKSPDGEMGAVRTWDLTTPEGFRVGILGSHQLDTELPMLIGHRLYIEKEASKSVGSRRVNSYIVIDLDTPRAV